MVLVLKSWMMFRKLIALGFLLHCHLVELCYLCEFLQRCSQGHAKQSVFAIAIKDYHIYTQVEIIVAFNHFF